MPNDATQPLFDEARDLDIGFCLGYALLETADDGSVHRWNVQTLVERDGSIVGTFKKVHIPGHESNEPGRPFQHLERYYFEPSPEGFGVWDAFGGRVGMMICNDRRWPESYRLMGLQGVELILCGYNTPLHYAPDPSQDPLQGFHNQLVMSSGAYQNGTFVVGVAKGGVEEGVDSLAESSIFGPSGELLARATTNDDELDRRRVRPRLVRPVQEHALRLRPLPPPRRLRPPHRPSDQPLTVAAVPISRLRRDFCGPVRGNPDTNGVGGVLRSSRGCDRGGFRWPSLFDKL